MDQLWLGTLLIIPILSKCQYLGSIWTVFALIMMFDEVILDKNCDAKPPIN